MITILRKKFDFEGMEFFHTKRVKITGGKGLSWTLDGEYAEGSDSVDIENIHSGITLIVPKENNKQNEIMGEN